MTEEQLALVIESATRFQRCLAAKERAYHDAAFLVENALRNARIDKVGQSGILHRQHQPYETRVEEVKAAVQRALDIMPKIVVVK